MSEKKTDIIKHNYIKNHDFRTTFCSSIFGGVTVNGLININFCIDRGAIPTQTESVVETIEDGGALITERKQTVRDGIVREVQFGTLLDINTAKTLVVWLNQRISQVDEAIKKTK